jgi:hypothetical protein
MELRENVGCMLYACCMGVIDVVWRLYTMGIMVEMSGGMGEWSVEEHEKSTLINIRYFQHNIDPYAF